MHEITRATLATSLLLAVAATARAAPPAAAPDALLGTWTLVSETAHQAGKTTEPLGPHPVGCMMLDRNGRFMLMIARTGLPRFAANRRDAGTPEENRAVLAGALAFFGTYRVDQAEGVLTLRPEASTFPNWIGADQKREFTVSGDELRWSNHAPAVGAEVVEVVWRRAR